MAIKRIIPSKVINKIRIIIFKLSGIFIPELRQLKRDLAWDFISKTAINLIKGNSTQIIGLYHISDSKIGDYTYVAQNSYISKTTIGKFCSIGPNIICGWGIHPTNGISTSPMFYSTLKQNGRTFCTENKIEERKPIKIGNDVFIGANVTVLDGVCIGDGAIIGAGAVVSKDIPAYAIAVGCPVKVIKYRFQQEQIDKLLKIKWWEFSEDRLPDVEKMFFDINSFIEKYA